MVSVPATVRPSRCFLEARTGLSADDIPIVRLTVLVFLDDALLTAHGIYGYDVSRHVQCIQKVWSCRDLIGFFPCYQFPEHHLVFRCKHTHNRYKVF